jgi:hypothetical protein
MTVDRTFFLREIAVEERETRHDHDQTVDISSRAVFRCPYAPSFRRLT